MFPRDASSVDSGPKEKPLSQSLLDDMDHALTNAAAHALATVFEPDAAPQGIEAWLSNANADAALAAAARSVANAVAARTPASAAERIARYFGR